MKPFYIMLHDCNNNEAKKHDIMPYLIDTYNACKKSNLWWPSFEDTSKAPHTVEDFKRFVTAACKQQYWSRCQYEWLMLGWPPGKTDTLEDCQKTLDSAIKIDGWQQIKINLDTITTIFMQNIGCN